MPQIRLQLSSTARGLFKNLGLLSTPLDYQILQGAKHLQTHLRVKLTAAGEPFADLRRDRIKDFLAGEETTIYHVRDILLGLVRGLDRALIDEEIEGIEIPLGDIIHLTRQHGEGLPRIGFVIRKSSDLFAFYVLKGEIIDLRERQGVNLSLGTQQLDERTLDSRGAVVFGEMSQFASKRGVSINEIRTTLSSLVLEKGNYRLKSLIKK